VGVGRNHKNVLCPHPFFFSSFSLVITMKKLIDGRRKRNQQFTVLVLSYFEEAKRAS